MIPRISCKIKCNRINYVLRFMPSFLRTVFGEGGCARAALAGGDGLDGSPDEADDAAVWPGRLSYLFMHVGIKLTRLETATHHQQKLKKQTISAARSLANSYVHPYVQL